jgi:hypothetical protein
MAQDPKRTQAHDDTTRRTLIILVVLLIAALIGFVGGILAYVAGSSIAAALTAGAVSFAGTVTLGLLILQPLGFLGGEGGATARVEPSRPVRVERPRLTDDQVTSSTVVRNKSAEGPVGPVASRSVGAVGALTGCAGVAVGLAGSLLTESLAERIFYAPLIAGLITLLMSLRALGRRRAYLRYAHRLLATQRESAVRRKDDRESARRVRDNLIESGDYGLARQFTDLLALAPETSSEQVPQTGASGSTSGGKSQRQFGEVPEERS